ncbi:hypoxia-inducible factor 1-alpha-like [Anneissia japonica]|uniref:hypoxia-inducible factor 1-alpha-like n=1 Tax=Anneissia japonica TaxID=1529436 RepID=UPI0014258F9D|nr:hypoxia-inducible factor 1-alpha-like [Anneissia japonica]
MPLERKEKIRQRNTSGSSDVSSSPSNSRAEKSRYAAKMRRDKEGVEITALSKLLPFPEEITSKLDKGSIIRLATSYLRIKKFSQKEGNALLDELKTKSETRAITSGNEDDDDKNQILKSLSDCDGEEGALMLETLNGFVIFISRKGRILFVSESVAKHLGINQHDMIGNSIVDYIHKDDQNQLRKQFQVKIPGRQTFKGYGLDGDDPPASMSVNIVDGDASNETEETNALKDYVQERQFFLRMRSVMSRRGSSNKGKVVGYRVVQFSGRLKLKCSSNSKGYSVEGLICLCRPIQPQPILEVRMDGNMFMSRHRMDMSFTFCDPRIITLIGYEPHELIGKTAYQFHNPLDANKVSDCHAKLIVKGSSSTKHYRFLGKNGDWVWMQTKATIIYNTNNEAQYVVCMNYVIGQEEGDRYLMLERMQKNVDSGIESGLSSPASDMMETDRVTPSPEPIEVPERTSTMCDADIAKLIPQPVLENVVIRKPYSQPPTLNIAALLKQETHECEKVNEMEVSTEKPSSSNTASFASCSSKPGPPKSSPKPGNNVNPQVVRDANCVGGAPLTNQANGTVVLKEEAVWPHEQYGSPLHSEPGSEASSNESSQGSPETNVHSGRSNAALSITEEDNIFNDLMEITMEDLQSDPTDIPVGLPPGVSFNLNSPDNLSQLMSPGLTMDPADSPTALQYEDFLDKPNKGPSILEKLLTPCSPCDTDLVADALKMKFPPGSGQNNFMNVTVTKIERPQSTSLPEDIANFTLEYNIENIIDNAAADAMMSAGVFDFTKAADNDGVTITEIPSDQNLPTGLQLAQDPLEKPKGFVNQPVQNGQGMSAAHSDSLNFVRNQSGLAPAPKSGVHDAAFNVNKQQVGSVTHGINVTPQGVNVRPQDVSKPQGVNISPQLINATQMQQKAPTAHVTERISKLEINDASSPTSMASHNVESDSKQSSILHSLLTQPGSSSRAEQPGAILQGAQGSNFMNNISMLPNGNVVQGPIMLNNNMEDQQLLEQFKERQKCLEEEQERQRLQLIQNQEEQRKLLQKQHLETLLRRQQMQREDFEQNRTPVNQFHQQQTLMVNQSRENHQPPSGVQFNQQPTAIPLIPAEEMYKILNPQIQASPINQPHQSQMMQTNGDLRIPHHMPKMGNNIFHGQITPEKQTFSQPQTSHLGMIRMPQNHPMFLQQQQQSAMYNNLKDSSQFHQFDGHTALPSRLPPPYPSLQDPKPQGLIMQQQQHSQMQSMAQPSDILHMNQVVNVVDGSNCDLFAANHASSNCILQQFN